MPSVAEQEEISTLLAAEEGLPAPKAKHRRRLDVAAVTAILIGLAVLCSYTSKKLRARKADDHNLLLEQEATNPVNIIPDVNGTKGDVRSELKLENMLFRSGPVGLVATDGPPAVAFDEVFARAFGELAMVAACGPSSGLKAAVSSCGFGAGSKICQQAGIQISPSDVYPVTASDLDVAQAISAYVAKVQVKNATGCLVSFRPSINNWENQVRNQDSRLEVLPDQFLCDTCKVHRGWWAQYQQMRTPLEVALQSAGCGALSNVWTTGVGTGAALAVFAAFDLRGTYKIQSSVFFHALQFGNTDFVKRFRELFGPTTPMWFVTEGPDQSALLPNSSIYEPLPYEVHYPITGPYEVCIPGKDGPCGVAKYQTSELSEKFFCPTKFVSSGSFCGFKDFGATCVSGGQSTGSVNEAGPDPDDDAKEFGSLMYHPDNAPADIDAQVPLIDYKNPLSSYNENMAKCLGYLGRALYCFAADGKKRIMQEYSQQWCEPAGGKVVPDSISFQSYAVQEVGDVINIATLVFTQVPCTRCNRDGTNPFPPGYSAGLIIRGSQAPPIKTKIDAIGSDMDLVPVQGCPLGGRVHKGYNSAWMGAEPGIMWSLGNLMARYPMARRYVFIEGFSFGGGLAPLAIWHLSRANYKVLLSYTFGGMRIGDEGFVECVKDLVGREVPVFRVNFNRDSVPHGFPFWAGYRHLGPEVWYDEQRHIEMCEPDQEGCGSLQFDDSSMSYTDHLKNVLFTDSNMAPTLENSERFYDRCRGSV